MADAAQRAGLVDEYRFLVDPVVIGRGMRFFREGTRAELELRESRPIDRGVVYLHYAVV